jgi:hypothetical protein
LVDIDFEYFNSKEKHPTLVCASAITNNGDTLNWWLLDNPEEQADLKEWLYYWQSEDAIICGFATVAEARCFHALHASPVKYRWMDYHSEYKCLLNHNDELEWGEQLIDGKVKKTRKPGPKWQRKESDKGKSQKAEKNLAAAVFKLLNIELDTERKELMRDIIISGDKARIMAHKDEIMQYCASDVEHLPELRRAILNQHQKLMRSMPNSVKQRLWEFIFNRGYYCAEVALIESRGYPVNVTKMRNFSNSVASIIWECQRDINLQFEFKPFRYDKRSKAFAWKQAETIKYLKEIYPELMGKWMKTDGGDVSLSLDAFSEFFDFRHDYPRGNFGAQMVRYLKLKQSLNGFVPKKNPKKKDKTIWDNTGTDGFVRPYTNAYGSQSSRNQPSATSFLFLKPAWQRVLCEPPKGYMMLMADWSSQEFLIGGLWANDKKMIAAYHSGDPYMWFGKAAGKIPKDATRETHGLLRDRFKSSVLGIMYLMGAESLALKITNDTGEVCTVDEAQDYIDMFDEVFYCFADKREEVIDDYDRDRYLMLVDGWFMWGDNQNFRSVANCPIQGAGGVCLRRAVTMARERGLDLCFTLHDALYPIAKLRDWSKLDVLAGVMKDSFASVFPQHKEQDRTIRSDLVAWSPEFGPEEKSIVTPKGLKVQLKQLYIDKRSLTDYNTFKHYLTDGMGLSGL